MFKSIAKSLFLVISLPLYAAYRLAHDLVYGTHHPAWGLRTSVICACCRWCASWMSSPDLPLEKPKSMPSPTFSAGKWKPSRVAHFFVGRGTYVVPEPAPAVGDRFLKGIALVGAGHIEPTGVPTFWMSKKGRNEIMGDASQGEKVVVYIAGGGTHPTLSPTPYDLARETGLRVLAVAYRPDPFPAPLLDTIAAYCMLVGKGFDSTNILLVGESAGAFEVLALLQYLKELRDEHKVDVGMPGGAAIVSPACNMARFDYPVVETDFRLPYYRRRLTPRLAYHFPLDEITNSPYFNPAHAPRGAFVGFPKTFLQFGSGELFADDIRALARGMKRDDVSLSVDEIDGGLHTEANIKRAAGIKAACWKRLMNAVQELGWKE